MTIQPTLGRVASIDVFRALTMFLMIFVNDFWTLSGVPKALQHAVANDDFIGFSDVIFPAFLFIVGLSIPLAVTTRRKNGFSDRTIALHILQRAVALWVMGVFMVNYENLSPALMPIGKALWTCLMVVALFLIWLDFKFSGKAGTLQQRLMQLTGWLLLVGLAVIFRSGNAESVEYFQIRWWGILGLIGWAYFFNALLYLFAGRHLFSVILVFLVFHLLHIQEFLPVGSSAYRLVVSSSNYTLVAGGMVISALLTHFKGQEIKILLSLLLIGLLVMVYGYALRPYWGGFSKIRATPSWTLVSLGWSVLSFWVLYILVDLFKWSRWSQPFYIAGRYTLTCYVLPYAVYQIMVLTNTVYWPSPWSVGWLGLLKAAVFSFLILGATALLVRFRIALKL